MQLDAWWQKLPKMWSLWRNWVVFLTFCDRVIEVSSLVTLKYLQFLAKIDFLMVGVDASWCLKAETDKNGFTLTILLFFLLFSVKVIKFHFGHWQKLAFLAKIEYFGKEWMQLDDSRLKLRKTSSLWRFLVILPLLCYRFIKVSSFWPHTKLWTFPQKLIIFG